MDVRKWGHSYTNPQKWVSHIQFPQKKGAYCIPGSTEKGGYSGRTPVVTWFDHDLFYGKVKFCNLGFSIGKSENGGFFRNYCSL